jgi:hypothetical protein
MPYNVSKSASKASKTVLRFAQIGAPRLNVVLDANDATAFPAPTDGSRFIVPAGTILKNSTVSGKVTKYNGSGTIIGILIEPVDLVANSTGSYEPAGAFWSQVVFATEKIVDFTSYISALVNDLRFAQFK